MPEIGGEAARPAAQICRRLYRYQGGLSLRPLGASATRTKQIVERLSNLLLPWLMTPDRKGGIERIESLEEVLPRIVLGLPLGTQHHRVPFALHVDLVTLEAERLWQPNGLAAPVPEQLSRRCGAHRKRRAGRYESPPTFSQTLGRFLARRHPCIGSLIYITRYISNAADTKHIAFSGRERAKQIVRSWPARSTGSFH